MAGVYKSVYDESYDPFAPDDYNSPNSGHGAVPAWDTGDALFGPSGSRSPPQKTPGSSAAAPRSNNPFLRHISPEPQQQYHGLSQAASQLFPLPSTATPSQRLLIARPSPDRQKSLADYFAVEEEPRTSYNDAECADIARLLKDTDREAWSQVPRIYTVLRNIGQLQAITGFLDLGMNDLWLPFQISQLPKSLPSFYREKFIQSQSMVLTKAIDLENPNSRKHTHFRQGEPFPFEVVEKLGHGGFASVDKVYSPLSRRTYARKRFRRAKGSTPKEAQNFMTELQNMKRINHQHCVELVCLPVLRSHKIHSFTYTFTQIASYTDPKYFGLLISPVADHDLSIFYTAAMNDNAKKPLLRSFFGCLAHALHFLHQSKIRHRDIKPQNILVKGDTVYLADFGISLDWENMSRSTTTEDSAKSWIYCAPEVANYQKRNSSSDVWSLGCVFLEMLTICNGATIQDLRVIFRHHSESARFYENINVIYDYLETLGAKSSSADKQMCQWIREMMLMNPSDRIKAQNLFESIASFKDKDSEPSNPLCGECCSYDTESSTDAESEDDIWTKDFNSSMITESVLTTPPTTVESRTSVELQPEKTETSTKHASVGQSQLEQDDIRSHRESNANESKTSLPQAINVVESMPARQPSRRNTASEADGKRTSTPLVLNVTESRPALDNQRRHTASETQETLTSRPSSVARPTIDESRSRSASEVNQGQISLPAVLDVLESLLENGDSGPVGEEERPISLSGPLASDAEQQPSVPQISPSANLDDSTHGQLQEWIGHHESHSNNDSMPSHSRVQSKESEALLPQTNIGSGRTAAGSTIQSTDDSPPPPYVAGIPMVNNGRRDLGGTGATVEIERTPVRQTPITPARDALDLPLRDLNPLLRNFQMSLASPCLETLRISPADANFYKILVTESFDKVLVGENTSQEAVSLAQAPAEAIPEFGRPTDQLRPSLPPRKHVQLSHSSPYLESLELSAADANFYKIPIQELSTFRYCNRRRVLDETLFQRWPFADFHGRLPALSTLSWRNPTVFLESVQSDVLFMEYLRSSDEAQFNRFRAATFDDLVPMIHLLLLNGMDLQRIALTNSSVSEEEYSPFLWTLQETWDYLPARNQVVKLLIGFSAKLDDLLTDGTTPLIRASSSGNMEILEVLLNLGTNPDERDSKGFSALRYAAQFGQIEAMKLLLDNGASAVVSDKDQGGLPIVAAASNGHLEAVKLLMLRGADPFQNCFFTGLNALMAAASLGYDLIVRFLLQRGGGMPEELDMRDPNGHTALHLAAQSGHQIIVGLLMKQGGHFRYAVRDPDGFTALHLAAQKGHHFVIQTLIENGAEVEATNNGGFTPLHVAANEGHAFAVQLLIENGANIRTVNATLSTPAYSAAFNDHLNVLRTLLDQKLGVDEGKPDGHGGTAWTPLHAAAMNGHLQVVEFLLDKGADPTRKAGANPALMLRRATPLSLAKDAGHKQIVALLEKHIKKVNKSEWWK